MVIEQGNGDWICVTPDGREQLERRKLEQLMVHENSSTRMLQRFRRGFAEECGHVSYVLILDHVWTDFKWHATLPSAQTKVVSVIIASFHIHACLFDKDATLEEYLARSNTTFCPLRPAIPPTWPPQRHLPLLGGRLTASRLPRQQ